MGLWGKMLSFAGTGVLLAGFAAHAQMTDNTQARNTARAASTSRCWMRLAQAAATS